MNLFVSARAKKDLGKLDQKTLQRIDNTLKKLLANPGMVDLKKLKGQADKWRLRVGDYRLILTVDWKHDAVFLIRVLHRKDAY